MDALLLLPKDVTNKAQIDRVRLSLAYRLKVEDTLIIAASYRCHEAWQRELAENIQPLETLELDKFGLIAYCDCSNEYVAYTRVNKGPLNETYPYFEGVPNELVIMLDKIYDKKPKLIYYYALSSGKLFHPPFSVINQQVDKHLYTHVYNALGERLDNRYYFFPYTYLYRCTGMGPTNEFGFRIPLDTDRYLGRNPKHKVIAVFGGSAAWSYYNLFEETFAVQLENKLNAYCTAHGLDTHFSVVNFSQLSNVVLDEIFNYMLYCQKLRPDIVIAHDGFNDLFYGQMSDPYLLNTQCITYHFNMERWSQILHNTKDLDLPQMLTPGAILAKNTPRAVIKSYLSRLLQFEGLAKSSGATFISGLQPTVYSRKTPSPVERKFIDLYVKPENCGMSEQFNNMPFIYDKYQQEIAGKLAHFIDFDKHFFQLGEDATLFGDIMHTSPEGEELIASTYCTYITENLSRLL
ncbi:hypothetical protein Geob_0657 [Geotalea daltonii FRC-32]|uniref:SGNH/GDSL hydrolase family protein n=1 Tax=Geotalea daltonii (strain DSM 22248 / JCM 15807 / FRC-32) TaxID=316067 RepID=B9M0I5_GEODF|nr:hypothetical protein [Geotalea daltonii]ACM19022.1 hypothetical protein Geob_0657 [Geotalea daltonii FRC-32]